MIMVNRDVPPPDGFRIQGTIGGILITLVDYAALLKSSDRVFAGWYKRELEGHKIWRDGMTPDCVSCAYPIDSPTSTVVYKGRTLHNVCFQEYYRRDPQRANFPKDELKCLERLVSMDIESVLRELP